MAFQIQVRRGTTAEWAAADPVVPAAGEPCFDTDTGILKMGDGTTTYSALNGITGGTITVPGEKVYTIPGTLSVGVGALRIYFTRSVTITNIVASVAVAPTGSSAIFDVNRNGTTIFTTQGNRPTIAISGFSDQTSTPDVTAFGAGDYMTIDVDQIGSTVAGADAVVVVEYTEAI